MPFILKSKYKACSKGNTKKNSLGITKKGDYILRKKKVSTDDQKTVEV